jgi:type IV secretory pathway VirB10-like protein
MTHTALLIGLIGLSGLSAACGGSPPPPPAAATSNPVAATTPAAPSPAAAPTPVPATTAKATAPVPAAPPAALIAAPAVPQGDSTAYEAKGRRDPFTPLDVTAGPKGLEVATAKLTGIVRGARTTLALVEAQDGIGYILKPGDTLGDGRLIEIGVDTVVFAVARSGSQPNRVVLRLAAN